MVFMTVITDVCNDNYLQADVVKAGVEIFDFYDYLLFEEVKKKKLHS